MAALLAPGSHLLFAAISWYASRTAAHSIDPRSSPLMSTQQTAARPLPYLINDADEHSTPNVGAYERYIDPDKKDMAIRTVQTDDGRTMTTYNGRPARFTFTNFQVVGSNDQLAEVGVRDLGA